MRVVLYAEGAAELVGEWPAWLASGDRLLPEHHGPAHLLVARALHAARGVPVAAVHFDKGHRKRNAAEPRGSDLSVRKTLLQLLQWPLPDMRPDLAVVLVDEDGRKERYRELRDWIGSLRPDRPPTVVAVARQEFEAWLVTDRACVESILARPLEASGDPESWEPGQAKRVLEKAIEASGEASTGRNLAIRREICRRGDLGALRASRSFRRLLDDLVEGRLRPS